MTSLLGEIKRRKVFKVAAVYAVVGWLLVQVITAVEGPLSLPGWADTLVIVLVVIGFPLALILAWAYDVTPRGIVRTDSPQPASSSSDASAGSEVLQPTRTDTRTSIVVLPFDNMSPDPENAYFADGLTEELIADLSKIESVRVISRTSAMSFRGTNKDVGTIARELDVRYVLEGSVRRAGDALRITAQLIDAGTDAHLWAEKYAGTVADIFDLQEQLSRRIVDALKLKLTPDEEQQLGERPISDLRAYEHYLRARSNVFAQNAEPVERAVADLKAALDILGDNVLLLRALGMAYWQQHNGALSDDPTLLDKVDDCARRIEELDSTDAGPHLLRGLAQWLRGDCRGAVLQLREAYRIDDTDRDTLMFLSVCSLSTGQMDDAGRLIEQLLRIDPLFPIGIVVLGLHRLFAGRLDEGIESMNAALQLDAEGMLALWVAVRLFAANDQGDAAKELAQRLRALDPASPFAECVDLMLLGLNGKNANRPPASARLREQAAHDSELSQYVSDAYAFAGDSDKALEWLEIALRAGFMNYDYLATHDPFILPYRDQPEWQAMLRKIKAEQQAFEAKLQPIFDHIR